MKLSTRFRYAVRFMIRLGLNNSNNLLSLNDISKGEKISVKYLSQIVLDLKKNELINTIRGPKGGYYINKDLDKITLLDIYEAVEGPLFIIDCINKKNKKECKNRINCLVNSIWNEFNLYIKDYLGKKNLKDLIKMNDN